MRVPAEGGTPVALAADELLAYTWSEDGRRHRCTGRERRRRSLRARGNRHRHRDGQDSQPGPGVDSGGQSADSWILVPTWAGIPDLAGQRAIGHLAAGRLSAAEELVDFALEAAAMSTLTPRLAGASVRIASSRAWAPAAWAKCSRRGTRGSSATSRSSCCIPRWRSIPIASAACSPKAAPRAR